MAQDSIAVNGTITLSEAQVAEAWKKLQEQRKKGAKIPNLTRVQAKQGGIKGVVITGSVQRVYCKHMSGCENCEYTVINERGGGSSYESVNGLLSGWTILEPGV